MPNSTTASETPLQDRIDRLAAFEPSEDPVISLYLDMRPDQHGRDNYGSFLRKTFAEHGRALKGETRASFDADVRRVEMYLEDEVRKSANGLAIFACSARNLFEAIQLDAPLTEHWLFLGPVPHLYPLARIHDRFPRYAALVMDTNAARLFVFGLGRREAQREVRNTRTRKAAMGGWSQARYQRHVENIHLHHMKEVVEVLDRTVREEDIAHIVLACDDVARPGIMEQLPQHLAQKVVDVVPIDINAPEHEVLEATLEALREQDAQTDAARVQEMLDAWHAGGLAVTGPEGTLRALTLGQVDELLITATPDLLRRVNARPDDPGPVEVSTSLPTASELDPERLKLADQLVTQATQTGARLRFIEDPDLLAEVGGVGALLRFRV
jgi:peptide chain release factor subunit 1